jgi:hypothetical protein
VRRLLCCAWLTGSLACVHRVETAMISTHSVRLLVGSVERETAELSELRADLEVDTDFERTPHVVATGETGLLQADGANFTLAGDEAGQKPLFIDNFMLFEVLLPNGAVSGKAVVGYVDGVTQGHERLDSLGQRAFSLGANEVSLSAIVPEHGQFRLRATALDIGGVGRVSDVFVVVTPKLAAQPDDLRDGAWAR